MIPSAFAYYAPVSAVEAVALLAAEPESSCVLGGGTWVVPELQRGESAPARVIDLRHAGLAGVEPFGNGVRIGAMTTYADLLASAELCHRAPLLTRAADAITGGWSIRNQGTVGGSVAAARPQSDLPAALVACAARAVIQGPAGERRLAVAELITGAMRTSLAADELLAGFELPAATSSGIGYVKLKRGASSWPIVTAAASVTLATGRCTAARLVLGAASATPIVVDLAGAWSSGTLDLADVQARAASAISEPWEDALAPGEYRAAVAGPVARRAMAMALADAGARPEGSTSCA